MRARGRTLPRRLGSALAGLATVVLAGVATVLVGAPAAQAEPTAPADATGEPTGPPIGPTTAGEEICTVNNPNLDEITGMVASGDVIYAVEGGMTAQPSVVTIWTINATTCEATSETYGLPPVDPQDLALGTDGALWVADIGLGLSGRSWVTMERVDLATGADAVPYRTLYPASGPINGTAVLLDDNNQPIIIGNSGQTVVLLRPDGPLPANTTEDLPTLQEVGRFTPTATDTPTPRGVIGRLFVTGAAMAPDRSKVVIRTESDAYEFTITGGDIVASITQGTPTITPLPDEENGQAITYSADGSRLLTLSATPNPVLRAYTPYVPPAPAPQGQGSGGGGGGSRISFGDITTIALITGFLGLVAVVVGVIGIVRARRQYFDEYPDGRAPARGPRGPRGRGGDRDRRGTGRGRWDADDDEYDDYGDEYGASRPSWPPRPRDDDADWSDDRSGRAPAHVGAEDDYGGQPDPRSYGGSTYGSADGRVYGSGGTTYGSGGTTYGSGGATYGSGGTTYGSGGTYGSSGHGSGGATYGSGGTTYGSGGTTYGSGRSGGRGGGGGGVYGRPRSDWDDEDPRHPYGRDNIDL